MEVTVMKNILGENDRIAAENQALFKEKNVYVLNLMGSPGAGKTSLLEKTMERIKDKVRMAVIEGDLFTSKDAERIEKHGVPVIQINTAGGCHLDAPMVQKTAVKLDLDHLDLLIVENVGNLVCPAEFDTGAAVNAVILSVPEGDDKPLKYPLMFEKADVVILNKCDVLPYFDFDLDTFRKYLRDRNDSCDLIQISAKTGAGTDELAAWIERTYEAWRA